MIDIYARCLISVFSMHNVICVLHSSHIQGIKGETGDSGADGIPGLPVSPSCLKICIVLPPVMAFPVLCVCVCVCVCRVLKARRERKVTWETEDHVYVRYSEHVDMT